MKIKNDSVSVIIPVFNSEKYIADTIDSVINQSLTPEQIIIIDDGSTDQSAKIINQYGLPVMYFFQTNAGANAARNKGVQHATGEFIALLDSDDLWEPDKLEIQMAVFADHPEIDVVFSHVQNFFSPDLYQEKWKNFNVPLSPLAGHIPSTLVIKKKALLSVGKFDEEVVIGDFMQWLFRARDAGLCEKMLADVLVQRRVHGNNTTIQEKQLQSQYLDVIREAMARRKKASE